MKNGELFSVVIAMVLVAIVAGLPFIFQNQPDLFIEIIAYSVVIVGVYVLSKKLVAYFLDADVEHRIWKFGRYGVRPHQKIPEVVAGVIVPLVVAAFALLFLLPFGLWIPFMAILTYETKALKHRAARRFGFYSYSEMSELHNGLIGAAGIVGVLLVSAVGYFVGLEYLAKVAAYFAFWNMIPFSNLDGTQIFFGNRILYFVLGIVTLIFTAYALLL